MLRPPPTSTLFPYTTLFRSVPDGADHDIGPKTRAVLAEAPTLRFGAIFGRRPIERLDRPAELRVFRGLETRKVAAEDLFGAISVETFGPGVPAHHASRRVQHEDPTVLHALHQHA